MAAEVRPRSPAAPDTVLIDASTQTTWVDLRTIERPKPVVPDSYAKTVVDYLLGIVFFILAAPLIVLTALAVRLTSSGPAFYTQTRLGRNGRPFRIYKIRTMYHNCEKISGAQWSQPGDTRITPLGAILRKSHLDELPQLINVLKGEMSLVGPRPERPEITPGLEKAIPRYAERLNVRPGVTGLAQIRLPADTNLDSVRKKLEYDLHYIEHRHLWLDLRLMAVTAIKVFGISLDPVCWLFMIPRVEPTSPTYVAASVIHTEATPRSAGRLAEDSDDSGVSSCLEAT